MANEFIIGIERVVKERIEVPVYIWQWSMEFAGKDSPGRLTVLLRPKLQDGSWDESAEVVRVEFVDDLSSDDPEKRYRASAMLSAILKAVFPADDPVAVKLGVAGKSVREGGQFVLRALAGL